MLKKIWGWLANKIISDCPPELSVCEFECRLTSCGGCNVKKGEDFDNWISYLKKKEKEDVAD